MTPCPHCNAVFRTPQGLGLHFHWGCPQKPKDPSMLRPRKPATKWAVHAIDPKRSTAITNVKEIVQYPLCNTPEQGYGTLFAKGPRFVTCKKCKKLLRAEPVISGTPPKPKVTRPDRPGGAILRCSAQFADGEANRCTKEQKHKGGHRLEDGTLWGAKVPPRPPGEAPWPTIADDAKRTLEAMRKASNAFYSAAIATGCHAFIEFTGLMNEYIKVCQDMSRGGDHSWLTANTHTDTPLKMHPHQAAYLAEKLDCIYGPTLRTHPALTRAFRTAPVKAKR